MTDFRRQMARETIRAREKAELARLRLELEHAKQHRRALIKDVRATCKRAKETLREKLKARRLELRRLEQAARRSERATCKARRIAARRQGAAEVEGAKRAIKSTRADQRLQARQASRKVRSTGLERRQESDEAAERDIPEDYRGLWRKMKTQFKGNARMSRAEQFLHWAHENPEEVIASQSAHVDREVARLVREHAAQHKKHRMRKTKAQIDAELRAAGVPF